MKFDMTRIKGAGDGLLNEVSKLQRANEMKQIFVAADEIDKAEENRGMSIEKIEGLADSIADVGLVNPIVIRQKEDGRYRIVAGERRYTAILKLIEDGRWEKTRPVKASLFEPELIDLPLTDNEKEDYVRATENAEQRDQTDGDRLIQVGKLKKIYEKLRENGAISNIKTRTLLAQDMKISPTHAAQFMAVDAKGDDSLIDAVLENQVSVSAASAITGLPKEEQQQIIQRALENKKEEKKITPKDLNKAHQDIRKRIEEPEQNIVDGTQITEKEFKKDIARIVKKLKKKESGFILTEEAYLKYIEYIEKIDKLFT